MVGSLDFFFFFNAVRSLDEGDNFRLTVKEEMFLARHLKEDRPGLLQAGVKEALQGLTTDQRGQNLSEVEQRRCRNGSAELSEMWNLMQEEGTFEGKPLFQPPLG